MLVHYAWLRSQGDGWLHANTVIYNASQNQTMYILMADRAKKWCEKCFNVSTL